MKQFFRNKNNIFLRVNNSINVRISNNIKHSYLELIDFR